MGKFSSLPQMLADFHVEGSLHAKQTPPTRKNVGGEGNQILYVCFICLICSLLWNEVDVDVAV